MSPEETEDWESPPHRLGRAQAAVVVAVVVAGALGSLWLVSARDRPAAQPSPTVLAGPRQPPCHSNELTLIGAINVCAHEVANPVTTCTVSGHALTAVSVLSDGVRRYLLYLDGGGAYQGPGTYQLSAWPEGTLGASSGPLKVALREYASGDLWQSEGGQVDVAQGARGGRLLVGLLPVGAGNRGRGLKLDGTWSC